MSRPNVRRSELLVPLFALFVVVAFVVAYAVLGLPSSEELVAAALGLFSAYGYPIVLIAAFVEALFMVGIYLPGSTVIVLAAVVARSTGLNLPLLVVVASAGFGLAYVIDYHVGRLGWYTVMARLAPHDQVRAVRTRLERQGAAALILAAIHPNITSVAVASCGLLGIPGRRVAMYLVPATLFWTATWMTLAFLVGDALLRFLDVKWVILPLVGWILISAARILRRS